MSLVFFAVDAAPLFAPRAECALPYLRASHRFHRPRSHDILGFGGELTTLETGVGVGSQSRTATTTKSQQAPRREPRAYRIARAGAMSCSLAAVLLPR